MVFKRFLVMLALRLALVGLTMALVVWLLLRPGFHSSTLLSSIALLVLVAELWRFVSRTNREVARKYRRNDPCWCASGLKFKRCHGGPAALADA